MNPPDNPIIKQSYEASLVPTAPSPPVDRRGCFKRVKAGGSKLVRSVAGAVVRPIAAIGRGLMAVPRAARNAVVHSVVYPTSRRIGGPDKARLAESRRVMGAVGAETVEFRTSDGEVLKGQYFDVKKFTEAIERMGGEIYFVPTRDDSSGMMRQTIAFKNLSPENRAILKKMGINIIQAATDHCYGIFPHHFEFDPKKESRSGVTILFLGNAQLYEYDRKKILGTLTMGQNCLAFNIRGTGDSSGSPTPKGTVLDAEAAYEFVKAKGFEDRDITLRGRCLGSAIAVQLATRAPLDLILEQPPDDVAKIPGAIAVRRLHKILKVETPNADRRIIGITKTLLGSSLEGYDSEAAMADVRGNLLILGATVDEVVPDDSAERLEEAANAAKNKDDEESGLGRRVEVMYFIGTHNLGETPETTIAISNFYRESGHLSGLPVTNR